MASKIKPVITDEDRAKVAKYATYGEIIGDKGCLAQLIPFKSNTLSAYFDEHYNYIVLSYGHTIAKQDTINKYKYYRKHPPFDNKKMRDHLDMVKEWMGSSIVDEAYNIKEMK